MISKLIVGTAFRGCCKYVISKVEAEILYGNGVRIDTLQNTISDFEAIRRLRPTIKNVVFHCSLSFAYEDKKGMTNEKLTEIGQAFTRKLGLSDHQVICVKHNDAKHHQHEHMHLIINRINFEGEAAPDKFIKNRAAKACDELEVEFGLTVARGHGTKTEIMHRYPKKNLIKEEIKGAVLEGLSSGINDVERLTAFLKSKDVELRIQYQGSGKVNGLSFRKDNIAFKGSAVDKRFSYKRLSKQLENSSTRPLHIEKILTKNKQIDYER